MMDVENRSAVEKAEAHLHSPITEGEQTVFGLSRLPLVFTYDSFPHGLLEDSLLFG